MQFRVRGRTLRKAFEPTELNRSEFARPAYQKRISSPQAEPTVCRKPHSEEETSVDETLDENPMNNVVTCVDSRQINHVLETNTEIMIVIDTTTPLVIPGPDATRLPEEPEDTKYHDTRVDSESNNNRNCPCMTARTAISKSFQS